MTQRRLGPINLDSYQPLREVVGAALRQAITGGILQPGERLMESQLAEELGVSRTPVREAIRKLELDGFVVMLPRRGTYVADLSLKDIHDLYEVRTALDSLAAELATERINEEELERLERLVVQISEYAEAGDVDKVAETDGLFHEIIYEASRNSRLIAVIHNNWDQANRYRYRSLAYPGRLKDTCDEHRRLVEAIAQRDAALAAQLAAKHIEKAEEILILDAQERRKAGAEQGPGDE